MTINRREVVRRGVLGALLSLVPARFLKAQPPKTYGAGEWVTRWIGGDAVDSFYLHFTRPHAAGKRASGRKFAFSKRNGKTGKEHSRREIEVREGHSGTPVVESLLPPGWTQHREAALMYGWLVGAWTAKYEGL